MEGLTLQLGKGTGAGRRPGSGKAKVIPSVLMADASSLRANQAPVMLTASMHGLIHSSQL